jgi:hypothetical protein
MQLRMTLAELGMSSVPSIFPIPRIGQTLATTVARSAIGASAGSIAFWPSFSGTPAP